MRGKAFGGAGGLRARRDVGGGAGGAGALGCEEDKVSSFGRSGVVGGVRACGGDRWRLFAGEWGVARPPCPLRTWLG